MSKFSPFEVARGGSDRLYYEHAVFPMGTYNTTYEFNLVTWKYGKMPVVFSSCDFERCVFDRVDLTYAVFLNCNLRQCIFRRCKLDMSTFIECTANNLSFRYCDANDILMMHNMLDGFTCTSTKLRNARISVNTEYLSPLVFSRCDLTNSNIENLGTLQYEGLFGLPALSSSDRLSLKIEKCVGKFNVEGFQYVEH